MPDIIPIIRPWFFSPHSSATDLIIFFSHRNFKRSPASSKFSPLFTISLQCSSLAFCKNLKLFWPFPQKVLISRTEFYRPTLWKVASTRSKGRHFHWNGIKRKLLCPTVKSLCQDKQRRHTDYCHGTECICFTSLSEAIKTQHNTKYTFESGVKKKKWLINTM